MDDDQGQFGQGDQDPVVPEPVASAPEPERVQVRVISPGTDYFVYTDEETGRQTKISRDGTQVAPELVEPVIQAARGMGLTVVEVA